MCTHKHTPTPTHTHTHTHTQEAKWGGREQHSHVPKMKPSRERRERGRSPGRRVELLEGRPRQHVTRRIIKRHRAQNSIPRNNTAEQKPGLSLLLSSLYTSWLGCHIQTACSFNTICLMKPFSLMVRVKSYT